MGIGALDTEKLRDDARCSIQNNNAFVTSVPERYITETFNAIKDILDGIKGGYFKADLDVKRKEYKIFLGPRSGKCIYPGELSHG